MTQLQQVLDLGYEVHLPVFEGPLDLLLYLVEKNELNTKDISIAAITDQYLAHLAALEKTDLGEAGEFLVMAARLMRLKARELLPAEDKDELEDMEYLLDRQALIAQMMEYQKFKEAARSLRNIESKHFGAFPRGRPEKPGATADEAEIEEEGEAGVYDLLAAFKSVLTQRPHIPVHEVEIDEVTIEDRMQHVETELLGAGRILFEDLFGNDPRRLAKVVTFMALLELCKLDRIVVRQNRAFGSIWVYPKEAAAGQGAFAQDLEAITLKSAESEPLEELVFNPGLVEWVQEQILIRKGRTALEEVLAELERDLRADREAEVAAGSENPGVAPEGMDVASEDFDKQALESPEIASLAAATLETEAPDAPTGEIEDDDET
jgi:chromatin segregation and condensation protein Rec8/ScpA/Scc1 (kleisin family)